MPTGPTPCPPPLTMGTGARWPPPGAGDKDDFESFLNMRRFVTILVVTRFGEINGGYSDA